MDILKLHYVYCQPMISIFTNNHKLLKEVTELENFSRFLRSTFICSSKIINEWILPGYSNNIRLCSKTDNAPCTLFVKEMRRFNHALAELYPEADLIFDLKKLNTSNFRYLYKILGDYVFERLLQDFDIFICLDQNRYAQIVGSNLSKKASTLIREISNRNCNKNIEKRIFKSTIYSPRKFLYAKDLRENLGRLKTLDEMLTVIFGTNLQSPGDNAKYFLKFAKQLNLRLFLDIYCPVNLTECRDFDLKSLSAMYCANGNVMKYINRIVRDLVPLELLGPKNLNIFIEKIEKYVVNSRKFDQFNLRCFTDGFSIKNSMFLINLKICPAVSSRIVSGILRFLLNFVFKLINCSFYVTDSQIFKNRILFYRKPLWNMIRRKMATKMKNLLIRSKNNRDDKFGPFAYKYIPKVSGFRPILLNYIINDRKIEKMNNFLKPYLAVLHDCFSENPHLVGQQQSDFKMIKANWRSYKENYSYGYSGMLSRKLYFVKADLESCFDSLLHQRLLLILENNLKPTLSPIYAVQKFCILAKKNNEPFRRYLFTAWPLDRGIGDPKKEILNFMRRRNHSDHSSKKSNRNNCIIVTNGGQSLPVIHRDELIQILRRFICENVVKLCRRFYLRKRGVAQGSTVSVALCNLYMADFERRKLKEFLVEQNRDLLMRHVDDYLYVTPDKDRAVKFARLMLAGCPDYGLKSSIDKMSINFDREIFSSDFVDVDKIAVCRHVSWCGLNFDSFTGQISSDDERWLRVDDFRDFITINYCKNADQFVLSRLNHYLMARNCEICFDDRINSPLVIRRNIRRAFIFLARCYQSFFTSFTNKRLKIRCDVVAASLAKKMYILLAKSSYKKKSPFTVKYLRSTFLSFCNQRATI